MKKLNLWLNQTFWSKNLNHTRNSQTWSFFFYQVLDPVRQWPHHGLTDRVFFIFFKSSFWPRRQWPYHSLSDQDFLKKILVFDQDVSGHTTICQTRIFLKRYFRLGRQWPYHGLTDWVRGMVTDVLGQKSDLRNLACETVVWPLT